MQYLTDRDFQDQCDEKIQANIDLIDIDEQFKESFSPPAMYISFWVELQ